MFELKTTAQLKQFLDEAFRDDVLSGKETVRIIVNGLVNDGDECNITSHNALYDADLTLVIGG